MSRSGLPYATVIPPAWRALAVLACLGGFFAAPVLWPALVWILYPRSRYLRSFAVAAGLLQALGLGLALLLRLPGYFFLIPIENVALLTTDQLLGEIFSSEPFALMLMLALGALTLPLLAFPGLAAAEQRGPRRLRAGGRDIVFAFLIALAATPFLFYARGLWTGGASGAGFPGLDVARFRDDPFLLFPGHFILVACTALAILAIQGKTFLYYPAREAFIQLQRDHRRTGANRRRSALWRARLLPGWGQIYAGEGFAGLTLLSLFGLILLFFWLSVGFVYGRLAEDIPGLNPNFAWYFLTQLGLRGHIVSDEQLRAIFGDARTLAGLTLALAACYALSIFATRWRFAEPRRRYFSRALSSSVLLHAAPAAIALLIPVTVLPNLPPPAEAQSEPQEVELFIPQAFDAQSANELNDSTPSGDEGDATTLAAAERAPAESATARDAPSADAQERRGDLAPARAAGGQDRDVAETSQESDGDRLKGERRKQTYSNYLSVKIRAPEDDLHFWENMPQPYHAVFEYKISRDGRVSDVRVVEPSTSPAADRLTIRLIESMGRVLPPPAEKGVVVTELFWNTGAGDTSLPSELKRALSTQFDGRIIEPLE